MIIGIDANEANILTRVGVNVIAFELLWSLYRLRPKNISFRIFLSKPPLSDLPAEVGGWQYEVFGPKRFWTLFGLPKRLYFGKPRPKVMFSPSHYGPLFSPIPFVISIMDLGFLKWPGQFTKKDYFQLKYLTKQSVKKAAKIITISNFSKNDIVEKLDVKPNKVKVVYPGFSKDEKTNIEKVNVKKKYKIFNEYFLSLGTLKPSKNIDRLIKAYFKFSLKNPKIQLIIAGKKGWLYDRTFKLVKNLNLEDKVIFTGYISEAEKQALLIQAKALMLPSLWEGFGIPVLEAMAVNVPVVCSKITSLPEVAGNAAIYINNPESEELIYKAMLKVVKLEGKERKSLLDEGLKQVKKFSWEKAAEQTLAVLKQIGGE